MLAFSPRFSCLCVFRHSPKGRRWEPVRSLSSEQSHERSHLTLAPCHKGKHFSTIIMWSPLFPSYRLKDRNCSELRQKTGSTTRHSVAGRNPLRSVRNRGRRRPGFWLPAFAGRKALGPVCSPYLRLVCSDPVKEFRVPKWQEQTLESSLVAQKKTPDLELCRCWYG